MVADAPRYLFDLHAALAAVDVAHRIEQNHCETPDRNEFEATFMESVIPAAKFVATRADRLGALARARVKFNALGRVAQACTFVHETGKMMAGIQQSCQQHG